MSHIPKKKLVDAATADGTMAEVSRLISASYLMANLMWSFFDDATEHLKKHGLLMGDMSRVTGRLNFSFKDYIAVFRDVFREQSAQMDFAGDFDIMKAAVIKALNQLDENKNGKEIISWIQKQQFYLPTCRGGKSGLHWRRRAAML